MDYSFKFAIFITSIMFVFHFSHDQIFWFAHWMPLRWFGLYMNSSLCQWAIKSAKACHFFTLLPFLLWSLPLSGTDATNPTYLVLIWLLKQTPGTAFTHNQTHVCYLCRHSTIPLPCRFSLFWQKKKRHISNLSPVSSYFPARLYPQERIQRPRFRCAPRVASRPCGWWEQAWWEWSM